MNYQPNRLNEMKCTDARRGRRKEKHETLLFMELQHLVSEI